jgi:hypothetical protein
VGRVVLHIGAMKTGTTFVQSVLTSQPAVLSQQGAAVLGGQGQVIRAIKGVRNPARWSGSVQQTWSDLASKTHQSSQTFVASMELLSFANDQQVAKFVEPFDGVRVDVVATVRDEFQATPAQWQSYCRSLGTAGWARYLREISGKRFIRRSLANKTFHRARRLGPVLERWWAQSGVSSVHVVIVPGPDAARDELWKRFCAAADLDPAPFELTEAKSNTSLGYGSCDLLRRMNGHLTDVDYLRYRQVMRRLAPDVLGPLRDAESRPEFDVRGAEFARSLNKQMVDLLSSGRFVVHGDLSELPVADRLDGYPNRPARPPKAETRRAAESMWTHLAEASGGAARRPPKDLDDTIEETARLLRHLISRSRRESPGSGLRDVGGT